MSVHRNLDGSWAECAQGECVLPFHVPDISVEEAAAMPLPPLLQFFELFDPPTVVDTDGTKRWQDEQLLLHRDYDLPALIASDGGMEWWQHGEAERGFDRPTFIWPNDKTVWLKNSEYHREGDRPAVIKADGSQHWFKHGKRHRDGGLPAAIRADGTQEWWVDDRLHREDGPAIVNLDGSVSYWLYGSRQYPQLES